MDFADLSKYDDLCSDVFLDALYLWFKTSKMNTDHRHPRIPANKVLDIIQRRVLQERNLNDAVVELLEIDYFRHYITSKSLKQKQEFVQHIKRYLYMYMPNAGYEISDTRRYKDHGKKVEACLVATKNWQVGDELRLCTGMIANLNPSEDAMLRQGEKDFSIMWSTRKGCSCLFLGPARFVNHDCDSNCKFISLGQNSVTFKVVKEIKCGEELTVFYGNHYFGENNNECRCATCEAHGEGYFSTYSSTTEDDANNTDGRRRSSRKRKSAIHDDYVTDHIPRAKRTTTSERRNSASVMSIDFLCGREQEEQQQQQQQQQQEQEQQVAQQQQQQQQQQQPSSPSQPLSSPSKQPRSIHYKPPTSPLDLLCDAVLDAESNKLTVLVGPTTNKDTTTPSAVSISMYYQQESSPLSDDLSSDTKADSAVGMSPHSHGWKEEYDYDEQQQQQQQQLQHTTHRHESKNINNITMDNDDDDDGLSDFLDDQSELSSIGSTELAEAIWSDDDDDYDDDEEDSLSNENNTKGGKKKKKAKFITSSSTTTTNGEANISNKKLACIACKRELRREEISEQVGCDTTITADLVTWTWTPSALFTDWRPKRCPRCERHFTVFRQEWPNRKIKKKKQVQADIKSKKTTGKKQSSLKKKSATKRTVVPTPAPLKIDLVDVFNNDDVFSPLDTPLSDFSGDEDELFNSPL